MKTRDIPITGFTREQLRGLLDEGAQALTDNYNPHNPMRNDPRLNAFECAMNHLMALLVRDLERV